MLPIFFFINFSNVIYLSSNATFKAPITIPKIANTPQVAPILIDLFITPYSTVHIGVV